MGSMDGYVFTTYTMPPPPPPIVMFHMFGIKIKAF